MPGWKGTTVGRVGQSDSDRIVLVLAGQLPVGEIADLVDDAFERLVGKRGRDDPAPFGTDAHPRDVGFIDVDLGVDTLRVGDVDEHGTRDARETRHRRLAHLHVDGRDLAVERRTDFPFPRARLGCLAQLGLSLRKRLARLVRRSTSARSRDDTSSARLLTSTMPCSPQNLSNRFNLRGLRVEVHLAALDAQARLADLRLALFDGPQRGPAGSRRMSSWSRVTWSPSSTRISFTRPVTSGASVTWLS